MNPETGRKLAELMRKRAERLVAAETHLQALAQLLDSDRNELNDYNRTASLDLLNLEAIGGLKLRGEFALGEVFCNRADSLLRRQQTRLHELVSPTRPLTEIGAAEAAHADRALRDLGLYIGAQGISSDPYHHMRNA